MMDFKAHYQNPHIVAMRDDYRLDETQMVERILQVATLTSSQRASIDVTAKALVKIVRAQRIRQGGLDAFMSQYDLSSEEGIALMCMAEALLRIPDSKTVDQLIQDKVSQADWERHIGQSPSSFVNAATWGLMLTGKILGKPTETSTRGAFERLATRTSEPVIRQAVSTAMRILGKQFVMGQTIEDAIKRAKDSEKKGYKYSYDMLGEGAYTQADADHYFDEYFKAISAIERVPGSKTPEGSPGISIKLSAIFPRYEMRQESRVMKELYPKLLLLAQKAKAANIHFTIDAEESSRLELSLYLIGELIAEPTLKGWGGLGLAVQAYQKRALKVLDFIIDTARENQQRVMVRLVKGAYWDTEIKVAQVQGQSGYPVFTRKVTTDVNYIACAKKLIEAGEIIYPQFATHNAHTVATIMELMKGRTTPYEFQCLHGMGQTLYDEVMVPYNVTCRIYAPVGTHEHLLAYLVRRLLENGANTSFVNRIANEKLPIEQLVGCPILALAELDHKPHPNIPLPVHLYKGRKNSQGMDLECPLPVKKLMAALDRSSSLSFIAGSGKERHSVMSPSDRTRSIGFVQPMNEDALDLAYQRAFHAFSYWSHLPTEERSDCLRRLANLLERDKTTLMTILIQEAGKTVEDALSEVREAIDFCYYYASGVNFMVKPTHLEGPTGETNHLSYHGRGVAVCISPWNFPLAIFTGQVCAALVTGNTVLAKPASQTPLIAAAVVTLMYEAGIPKDVLHLAIAPARTFSKVVLESKDVGAVLFTGSTDTAWTINKILAGKKSAIIPFIAETGGQNAMIVDSTALPEQVVKDVINSAFKSAGQRCSALRVLFLQEDVSENIIKMLMGAMDQLRLGAPMDLSTDIGPVIDKASQETINAHIEQHRSFVLKQVKLSSACDNGSFVAPTLIKINSISDLKEEVFGPVLHVVVYKKDKLVEVVDEINATGYGLTLGVHSRISKTIDVVVGRAKAGNIYINRNTIGAVVGVQPFGGEGLSGTGPKAGGPNYLKRLTVERVVTVDTTAAGGNASLLALSEK